MSREMKNSGVPWIGDIPNYWSAVRIKDLADNSKNDSFTDGDWIESQYITDNGIRYYTSGNVGDGAFKPQGNGYISEETFAALKCKYAYPGDLVIARLNAPFGRSCILPSESDKYVLAVDIAILRTAYCKEYLNYAMQCQRYHHAVEEQASGTAMQRISRSNLGKIKLPIPPMAEQKSIVHYLDSHCSTIDSAISKHHQIIEKLEEYRKAVITQAVTKGLNQNVEMKYSCIPWVTSIPEKWSEQPLKLLFSNRKNKNTDCAETNLLSLSYGRIIRKDINSNEGLLPENFSGYNIIEPNDIVLRLTDLQNDHRSLRTGLVTEHGIITSAYVTLCPKANINSEYYHYLLHAYDVQKVFYTLGEGIRQSLKYEDLGKVLVPVPPRVEQDEIVHYLNAMSKMVDDVIDKHNQLISKLQEYKQSLIYNAVTGKIDCTTEA